jgi:diaminohydroxyphosphoribosylaminopyrimidine deaminase/5-amino-6-(5-phosphoribosylamino)uracil reductase
VHEWRGEFDAVLVGTRTALLDNPELTVRLADGRHPRRLVLDQRLELPTTLKLFTDEGRQRTTVVTACLATDPAAKRFVEQGITILTVPLRNGRLDLVAAFAALGRCQIASILVEAGGTLAANIIENDLADEILYFLAPLFLGAEARPAIGALPETSLDEVVRYELRHAHAVDGSSDILVTLRRRRTA